MKFLTVDGSLSCIHGGRVDLSGAGADALSYNGQAVVVKEKLLGAPIQGCPLAPSPSTKPCTCVTSVILDQLPKVLAVDAQTPLLPLAMGMTDSVPPGIWKVDSTGGSGIALAVGMASTGAATDSGAETPSSASAAQEDARHRETEAKASVAAQTAPIEDAEKKTDKIVRITFELPKEDGWEVIGATIIVVTEAGRWHGRISTANPTMTVRAREKESTIYVRLLGTHDGHLHRLCLEKSHKPILINPKKLQRDDVQVANPLRPAPNIPMSVIATLGESYQALKKVPGFEKITNKQFKRLYWPTSDHPLDQPLLMTGTAPLAIGSAKEVSVAVPLQAENPAMVWLRQALQDLNNLPSYQFMLMFTKNIISHERLTEIQVIRFVLSDWRFNFEFLKQLCIRLAPDLAPAGQDPISHDFNIKIPVLELYIYYLWARALPHGFSSHWLTEKAECIHKKAQQALEEFARTATGNLGFQLFEEITISDEVGDNEILAGALLPLLDTLHPEIRTLLSAAELGSELRSLAEAVCRLPMPSDAPVLPELKAEIQKIDSRINDLTQLKNASTQIVATVLKPQLDAPLIKYLLHFSTAVLATIDATNPESRYQAHRIERSIGIWKRFVWNVFTAEQGGNDQAISLNNIVTEIELFAAWNRKGIERGAHQESPADFFKKVEKSPLAYEVLLPTWIYTKLRSFRPEHGLIMSGLTMQQQLSLLDFAQPMLVAVDAVHEKYGHYWPPLGSEAVRYFVKGATSGISLALDFDAMRKGIKEHNPAATLVAFASIVLNLALLWRAPKIAKSSNVELLFDLLSALFFTFLGAFTNRSLLQEQIATLIEESTFGNSVSTNLELPNIIIEYRLFKQELENIYDWFDEHLPLNKGFNSSFLERCQCLSILAATKVDYLLIDQTPLNFFGRKLTPSRTRSFLSDLIYDSASYEQAIRLRFPYANILGLSEFRLTFGNQSVTVILRFDPLFKEIHARLATSDAMSNSKTSLEKKFKGFQVLSKEQVIVIELPWPEQNDSVVYYEVEAPEMLEVIKSINNSTDKSVAWWWQIVMKLTPSLQAITSSDDSFFTPYLEAYLKTTVNHENWFLALLSAQYNMRFRRHIKFKSRGLLHPWPMVTLQIPDLPFITLECPKIVGIAREEGDQLHIFDEIDITQIRYESP